MVAPTLETRLSSKIRQKSNVINLDRQKTAIKVKFRDSGESFCVTVEFTLYLYYITVKSFCQYFPLYSGLLRYVALKRVAQHLDEPCSVVRILQARALIGI